MVIDNRQRIREAVQTAFDEVMKEHSRQELIDKKMQEISERMNKLDARMQTISHVFMSGANSVDLSEFGEPFESDSLKIYVDTKNNKMRVSEKRNPFSRVSFCLYQPLPL